MSKTKSKNKWTEIVECQTCKKSMQRKSLLQHLQTHEEAGYLCDICKVYKTTRESSLRVHKRLVHNIGHDSLNDCIFCKKKLNSYSALEKHLRCHIRERGFLCKICSGEFLTKNNLTRHMETHDSKRRGKIYCQVCSKGFFRNEYLHEHMMRMHSNDKIKPFRCTQCPKQFLHQGNLNTHVNVHTNVKSFVCEICKKQFKLKPTLEEHLNRVHLNWEKRFGCGICSKQFKSKNDAGQHRRKVHMKEDFRFSCKECSKRFFSKWDLAKHQFIHGGTKPKNFPCQFCDKRFDSSSHLSTHLRLHTGERPYKCKVCKKGFAQNVNLKTHYLAKHPNHMPSHIQEILC